MAVNVVEIVDITDGDEEVKVIYSTPVSIKSGATKIDAIPVETYRRTRKTTRDLLSSLNDEDDDVVILDSTPKTRRKIYKGECSYSKEPKKPLIFTCEICAYEKPISDEFRVQGCAHSYCTDCIGKFVEMKLGENIATIKCPVSECKGYFEPHHCRFILPKEVFDRWGDALCEAVILSSEKFYCPYKDCSALLIDESGGSGAILQSECPDCNRLFCARCKVPWHSGIKCGDFQILKKDERSNEDIVLMNLAKKKKWMRCPMCQFYVSRTVGCNYMRCRCGHSFCYHCGSPLGASPSHHCKKRKH